MRRAIGLALLVTSVASCGASGPSESAQQNTVAPASVAAPSSALPSPSTDVEDQYRTELEAALKLFEGSWYLFCFGVDDDGNMPKDPRGGVDVSPLAAFSGRTPPQGWLTVANEVKDLVALAEQTSLTAIIIAAQYRQDQQYEAANAAWQVEVIAPCANSDAAIRSIRERADDIP